MQTPPNKGGQGAHAIFAVTNFWEHLFTGKSQTESGEIEQKQALALAKAADSSQSLEHYVWSTLPNASKTSNGNYPVPHTDYKAEVDEKIREQYPNLAKKTTYLFVGYYPQNMAFFPFLRPMEWVSRMRCVVETHANKTVAWFRRMPHSDHASLSQGHDNQRWRHGCHPGSLDQSDSRAT